MKKVSFWSFLVLVLSLGMLSCEENENFDVCPEVTLDITNQEGSAVYRFFAQFEGIQEIELSWTIDGIPVGTGNLENISEQILDYRFDNGKYTVCVINDSETCPIEVCKEINVEIDETDNCPDLFFRTKQIDRPNTYLFLADFEGAEVIDFEWFIDGELQDLENIDGEEEGFVYSFMESGIYEVCIQMENEDCPEGASYCKTIEVKEKDIACDRVYFDYEIDPDNHRAFIFEIVLEEIQIENISEIHWLIDGERIQNPLDQQLIEIVLPYQLVDGFHTVCIKIFSDDCPEGALFCKEIEVGERGCPELSFEKYNENEIYYFMLNKFDGIEEVTIAWYLNGEQVATPQGELQEFHLDDLEIGNNEVCVFVETEACPEGIRYCKEFVVEDYDDCPDEIYFEAERDGDNLAYYFYPSYFDGINEANLRWFVNDDFVGESKDFSHDNPFYYQFGAGTYEVCLEVITERCPDGIKICKEIIISEEDPMGCPDLFFEIEREGDTSGYNFYASFEGINQVSYEWMIDGQIVDSEIIGVTGRDNYLYYQFNKGTFEICIITETQDCPEGISYCKQIAIE